MTVQILKGKTTLRKKKEKKLRCEKTMFVEVQKTIAL